MSAHERCPMGCTPPLVARTNGMGRAYLECSCGYVEPVVRKADPFPSTFRTATRNDGTVTLRVRGLNLNSDKWGQGRRAARALAAKRLAPPADILRDVR